MFKIDVNERRLGVNFADNKEANVLLWAPLAKKVELLLVKSKEKILLEQAEMGYWKLTTNKLAPQDAYLFVLDGQKERPDPASLYQPKGVHEFSEALDLKEFSWTDQEWESPLLDDYIIYELHTGTFTPKGTFEGIEEKLDYLKDLGITAIEIMPVSQFPGERNWGYDGVLPFCVQNSYGGANALRSLVDRCHQKGIAVILDVVYNHFGPEGNYFGDFAPYFTDKYKTPWGSAVNFDDAGCDGVRHYFIENTLMWFRDFHIDALRMDAVHAMKDFSASHILQDIRVHVNQLMEETGRTHHLIVELDLNDSRFIDPLEEKGYGMDAQWIDEFHHALRVTAGGERKGYYSDFEGIAHLAKAYKDAYVYDGLYSPHREKTFGNKVEKHSGKQFIVFSQNHDQVGNRMLGERTSQLVSFEMQKLLAGAVMVSPYLPMLFMGEEYSESNPFQYFVSHTDAELGEAVRKGRRAEFAAFHDEGEVPDPMAKETFLNSKLQWELIAKDQHKVMLDYYKSLIALRKKNSALSMLSRDHMDVYYNEADNTLILMRWQGEQKVCCAMNFSKLEQLVVLPSTWNRWHKVLDSADPEWNGPVASPNEIVSSATVTMQPESLIIYINNHV